MKLLLYSHFFVPSIGGVETIVLSLAEGLAELRGVDGGRQFEVTLVTSTPAGRFDERSLLFRVVRQPSLVQLAHLVRAADVIHVAGPAIAPMALARFSGKPLVIEHHGYQAICPNGLLFHHPTEAVCPGYFQAGKHVECLRCNAKNENWSKSLRLLLLTFLRNALSRGAAANIAPTGHVMKRIALPRSAVIHHGVTDPHMNSSAVPNAGPGNRNSFAYVGRLVKEKGVLIVLEAVQLLRQEGRDIKLQLIGDGPERAQLEARIAAADLASTVHLAGFLSAPEIETALSDVGTIIMPTIMEETAGLAVVEQMMRGRAVIVSSIGGLPEMVGNAGLTFTPNDSAALADCMRRILDEPGLSSSLGTRARERARRLFERTRMIEEHCRVYFALLSLPRE